MNRRAIVAAACAALVTLAGAAAAFAAAPSAVPGTLGLLITPAPLALSEGGRKLTIVNRSGGLALSVSLTVDDPAFTAEPATFTLALEGSQVVSLVTVGPGDAKLTVRAEATSAIAGVGVTSAIVLVVGLRWASPLEKMAAQYGPIVTLAALTVALCAAWAIRRRNRT